MLDTNFSPWPSYTEEEIQAVSKVLSSNRVNYWTGTETAAFEKEFAIWSGSEYAIALANGTLALELALLVLGIGVGDEVIVTSRTFIASISCIVRVGATPVFADVDKDSQNITKESIAAVLSPKTKAIICVHLAGWPCEMDEIMELANQYDLYVIEDCAQAHGARYKGRSVGSIGHISAWSFCQDKIITTGGEGGMVTTQSEVLWKKMWSYKDHGKSWDAVYHEAHSKGFRWLHTSFGSNYRMTEMQAVIGRIQLRRMAEWGMRRLQNAESIWDVASKIPAFYVPKIPQYIQHAAYKCYLFVDPDALKADWNRDRILENINAEGVPCYTGSCSEVYLEKAFAKIDCGPKQRLPLAKQLGETSLMFLVHPTLTDLEIQKTLEVLKHVGSLACHYPEFANIPVISSMIQTHAEL